MEPARAAESDQRELSRIVAVLNRDHAYRLFHRRVYHPDDSSGELFRRKLRPVPLEPFGHQAACALEIESEISAQKALRLQPAEQQVGIRHRGLGAATVADRTRIRSSRFRTDAQGAAGIEAGDGTSPSAYSMNVEHGHANREPGDLGLAAGAGFAIYQRNVGGGAAHVE